MATLIKIEVLISLVLILGTAASMLTYSHIFLGYIEFGTFLDYKGNKTMFRFSEDINLFNTANLKDKHENIISLQFKKFFIQKFYLN